MNTVNYNVNNCDRTDKNNRLINFKLKNINNKINEQKVHIEQLKEAISNKETNNMLLEKRLDSLQKFHGNRLKEIEEQTQKMEEIQKSVWHERNALEAKINELEQKQNTPILEASLKERDRLNGRKNGLINYLSKTDEQILKLKNRIDDVKKDQDSLIKNKKRIL